MFVTGGSSRRLGDRNKKRTAEAVPFSTSVDDVFLHFHFREKTEAGVLVGVGSNTADIGQLG